MQYMKTEAGVSSSVYLSPQVILALLDLLFKPKMLLVNLLFWGAFNNP